MGVPPVGGRAKMALRLGPQTRCIAFGHPLMGKMPMLLCGGLSNAPLERR